MDEYRQKPNLTQNSVFDKYSINIAFFYFLNIDLL